jgi:RNA recognition motif-containing protein
MGASSCFADFKTHVQAQRAMESMDGMPLLGREVEIEIAQETSSVYERAKHPSPVKTLAATRRTSRF